MTTEVSLAAELLPTDHTDELKRRLHLTTTLLEQARRFKGYAGGPLSEPVVAETIIMNSALLADIEAEKGRE